MVVKLFSETFVTVAPYKIAEIEAEFNLTAVYTMIRHCINKVLDDVSV